jgi:hypothetical protein
MKPDRYTAHTIDGSPIFHAPTMQRISDAVIDHTRAGKRPHVAYVRDSEPGAFPFSVWKLGEGIVAGVGTPCRDFAEVCAQLHMRQP